MKRAEQKFQFNLSTFHLFAERRTLGEMHLSAAFHANELRAIWLLAIEVAKKKFEQSFNLISVSSDSSCN